ncbi:unnamed protein product [Trichogramma brassicae]|uniref:Uncharacterized protein n=1 Tax=Trichogramma brassicae TaxID=86971 RepID=A0A6H5IJQ7_9HYME|nr:unnamed protein product [Trichogramma brassicae]
MFSSQRQVLGDGLDLRERGPGTDLRPRQDVGPRARLLLFSRARGAVVLCRRYGRRDLLRVKFLTETATTTTDSVDGESETLHESRLFLRGLAITEQQAQDNRRWAERLPISAPRCTDRWPRPPTSYRLLALEIDVLRGAKVPRERDAVEQLAELALVHGDVVEQRQQQAEQAEYEERADPDDEDLATAIVVSERDERHEGVRGEKAEYEAEQVGVIVDPGQNAEHQQTH